jgi:hypothetical protein
MNDAAMDESMGAGPAISASNDARLLGLFPTNRYNLLEILSFGIVAPRAAYDKYYHDLLEATPGRVPLFAAPICDEISAICTSEGTATFPVIVELRSTAPHLDKVPSIDGSGNPGKTVVGENAVAWAPDLPFALNDRCIIHFRTSDDLEEHQTQEYENVRNDDWTYLVSPQLFGGASGTKILDWLSRLGAVDVPSAEDYKVEDKLGGAIALLLGGRQHETSENIGRHLLNAAGPGRDHVPGYLSYLIHNERRNVDRESRLFYAVISTLRGLEPKTFAPTAFLTALPESEELQHLRRADREFVSRGLDRVRKVVANELEFVSFPSNPGSAIMRALMLFALRSDPKRLTGWDPAETNATGMPFAMALLFAGYLSGRKRMAHWYRPKAVDRQIAALTVRRLTGRDKRGKTKIPKPVADHIARFGAASTEAERIAAGRTLAKACGWGDCIRDESIVHEDDLEPIEQGLVRVRMRKGTARKEVFSTEDLEEHLRLQFGVRRVHRD